jgi:hypothetical protein
MTLDEFFLDHQLSKVIFKALCSMMDRIGPTEIRVSKSQVAFWRRMAVARAWIPARYLKGDIAPLVLTLGFDQRHESPRWKEIVEPAPRHYTHHLELWSAVEVDEQVQNWLQEAWQNAE